MGGLFLKLDTNFWSHPRVLAAGEPAAVLYQKLIAWSLEHRTDGHVSCAIAAHFDGRKSSKKLENLVSSGLVERHGDDYVICGFAERYRSADEVADLREKRREAGRKGGRPKKQTESTQKPTEKPNCFPFASTARNPDVDVDVDRFLTTAVTQRVPVLAAADVDEATQLWRAAGIVRPEPTDGDRKAVARAIRQGWTVEALLAKATHAADAGNPRAYLAGILASPPPKPTRPRPDERRGTLDDERPDCPACSSTGWVDTWTADGEHEGVDRCPACDPVRVTR
jgi:hypothetical protein